MIVRASGPFTVTDLGTVLSESSVSTGKYFWEDDGGDIHGLFCVIGYAKANLFHINFDTGDNYALSVNGIAGLGYNTFAYYNGYLYFSAYNNNGYTDCYRYNSAGTLTKYYTLPTLGEVSYVNTLGRNGAGTITQVCIGTDKGILVVDPSNVSNRNYYSGFYLSETSQCDGIAYDGTYLYAVCRVYSPAYRYLVIYKLDGTDTSYVGDDQSYTSSDAIFYTSKGWQAVLDGNVWTLSGGTATPDTLGSMPSPYLMQDYRTTNRLVNQDGVDDNGNLTFANVDMDISQLNQWSGNPEAYFYYRNPGGSGSWTTIDITYTEDITTPGLCGRIMPVDDTIPDTVMFMQIGYGFKALFNIVTQDIDYLGQDFLSLYCPLPKVGSKYYWAGYPFAIAGYDSTQNWTITPFDHYSYNPAWESGTNSKLPEWLYNGVLDKNNVFWFFGDFRSTDASVGYWNPTTHAGDIPYTTDGTRSIGVANGRSKIVVGDNNSQILVFDSDSKLLEKTIDLSTATGITRTTIVGDISDGNDIVVVVSDEGSNYKAASVNIDTEAITNITTLPDLPFGYTGGSNEAGGGRAACRLPRGPDGLYLLMCGNHLYAIDLDCNLTDVKDLSAPYMITYVSNNLVLNTYSSPNVRAIYDFYEEVGFSAGTPIPVILSP